MAADELRDLAAVERQLQRWRQSGRLTSKEFEKLLDRVRGYREGLLHPAIVRQEERPAAAQPAARAAAPATLARTEEPVRGDDRVAGGVAAGESAAGWRAACETASGSKASGCEAASGDRRPEIVSEDRNRAKPVPPPERRRRDDLGPKCSPVSWRSGTSAGAN